jgi:hypothetical protein
MDRGEFDGVVSAHTKRRNVEKIFGHIHFPASSKLHDTPLLFVGIQFEIDVQRGTMYRYVTPKEPIPPTSHTHGK